jgi:hypothetical protein
MLEYADPPCCANVRCAPRRPSGDRSTIVGRAVSGLSDSVLILGTLLHAKRWNAG